MTESDLEMFTGTDNHYRHGLARHVLYTDGVRYLAEKAGAYWLIDAIASHLVTMRISDQRLSQIQFWTLEVKDNKAILYCQADAGEPHAVEQVIEFTDFPLASVRIWAARQDDYWVLLLPSEY